MTREEHIYQLEQYLKGHSICMCPSSSLYWKEHYEEIIKVLEQEPTAKNNLDVTKAIEILKADNITGYSVEDVLNARDMAIKALEQGPCDKCEVGNPCLYCKYGFEPQESEET